MRGLALRRPTSKRWLSWPAGTIRVGVVFLVGVAVVVALVGYPGIVRDLQDAAARGNEISYADREIAGGNSVVGDQQAVYQARGRIPEDATFRVAVGEGYQGESELTAMFVFDFYRYFLMPRRPANDAPWVICYGCDVAGLGEEAAVVWRGEDGISIVRVGP